MTEKIIEAERKKERWKGRTWQIAKILLVVIFTATLLWASWTGIKNLTRVLGDSMMQKEPEQLLPTIDIVDESGQTKISSKVSEFVAKLEKEFGEKGYKVVRAVLPVGKRREIDIYLDGVSGYYKMNLDRGIAESVEAAKFMIDYLGDREVEYVDVRVAGKGYYK